MKPTLTVTGGFVFGAVALTLAATAVEAQTAEAFYKGKQVELVTSSASSGNGFYARAVSRHMKKHIPGNPNVVIKEMPGAGGLTLINYLANIAPKDGLVFGTMDRALLLEPLLGNKSANYDASKFSPIASIGKQIAVCYVGDHSPAKTYEQVTKQEVIMGSNTPTGIWTIHPMLLNALTNTKFKVIVGYPQSQDILLAIERKEVHGMCPAYSTVKADRPDWIRDKKLIPLFQVTFNSHPELVGVPTLNDLTKDELSRKMLEFYATPDQFGRPYLAPAGVPAERVQALRRAFDATMKDPEFIAEAKSQNLDIDPITGEEVEKLLKGIYATPPDTIHKVIEIVRPKTEQKLEEKKS